METRKLVLLGAGAAIGLLVTIRSGCNSGAARVELASPPAPRSASAEVPVTGSTELKQAGWDRQPQVAHDVDQPLAAPAQSWRAVGLVTSAASRPLGGCEVVVTRVLGGYYRTRIGLGTTDSSGHYSIPLPELADVGPYLQQFSLVVSASADARIDIYVETGTRYEVRAQLGKAATPWKEVRTSRENLDADVALLLRSDAE